MTITESERLLPVAHGERSARRATRGAIVEGLDLRVERSPDVREQLDRALHEHGVLFVHERFAFIFGPLHELSFNRGTDRWHTDAALVELPDRITWSSKPVAT